MKITQTKDQLIAIGEKVDDRELVSLALNGIPTSSKPFIHDVCARDALPTLDRLWTDCVQEEGRILSRSGSQEIKDEENLALAT